MVFSSYLKLEKRERKIKEENELMPEKITILDPDGWDRSNYDYSFNKELITKEEFDRRLMWSTCIRNKK